MCFTGKWIVKKYDFSIVYSHSWFYKQLNISVLSWAMCCQCRCVSLESELWKSMTFPWCTATVDSVISWVKMWTEFSPALCGCFTRKRIVRKCDFSMVDRHGWFYKQLDKDVYRAVSLFHWEVKCEKVWLFPWCTGTVDSIRSWVKIPCWVPWCVAASLGNELWKSMTFSIALLCQHNEY